MSAERTQAPNTNEPLAKSPVIQSFDLELISSLEGMWVCSQSKGACVSWEKRGQLHHGNPHFLLQLSSAGYGCFYITGVYVCDCMLVCAFCLCLFSSNFLSGSTGDLCVFYFLITAFRGPLEQHLLVSVCCVSARVDVSVLGKYDVYVAHLQLILASEDIGNSLKDLTSMFFLVMRPVMCRNCVCPRAGTHHPECGCGACVCVCFLRGHADLLAAVSCVFNGVCSPACLWRHR